MNFFSRLAGSTRPQVKPIDIENATEANVPELDPAVLVPSVDLIVRHHFDPTTVHDPDLALFARAAALAGEAATFLDIGANMGNTIASLAALECRFTIHAFEINPARCTRICGTHRRFIRASAPSIPTGSATRRAARGFICLC